MDPEEIKTIKELEEEVPAEKSAIKKWQEQNEAKKELAEGKPLSINPEADQFVMVHMTKYFPDGGIIKTTGQAREEYFPRESIHFSLNGMVAGGFPGSGDWDNNPYAIIVPLEKAKDRIVDLYSVDTWVVGEFGIPEGSEIVFLEDTLTDEEIARLNSGNIRVRIEKDAKTMKEAVTKRIAEKNYTPAQSGTWAWDSLEVLDEKGQRKILHGNIGKGGTTEYIRQLQKNLNIPLSKPHSESSLAALENNYRWLVEKLDGQLFEPQTGFKNLNAIGREINAISALLSKSYSELSQKMTTDEEKSAFLRIDQSCSRLTRQALDKIRAEFGPEMKSRNLSLNNVNIKENSLNFSLSDQNNNFDIPCDGLDLLTRSKMLGGMFASLKENGVAFHRQFSMLEDINSEYATNKPMLTLYLTQALYGKDFADPNYRTRLLAILHNGFAEIRNAIDQKIRAESGSEEELAANQKIWNLDQIEEELTKAYFADLKESKRSEQ